MGAAIDAVVDADAAWFRAHKSTTRHRPITPAERAEFRLFGFWEAAYWTTVQVILVGPGLRVRHPHGGGLVGRPYTPDQVEQIFARDMRRAA